MDDATLTTLRVIASAVVDIGFATLVGALVTAAMLRDARSAWAACRARRTIVVLRAAALVALAGSLVWMWEQAIAMTELAPWAALAAAGPVVTDTAFGRAWALQALVLLLLAAWSFTPHARVRRGFESPVTLAGPALFAALRASAGHAGAAGMGAAGWIMALHLGAMAAWAGAVLVGVLAILRENSCDGPTSDVVAERLAWLERLSRLATGALALVVATGIASAWRVLGALPAPGAAWAALAPHAPSSWGPTLVVKGALVALAAALGAFNRFATLPALRRESAAPHAPAGPSWRRLARVLQVEAAVLVAVMVAAALLGNGELPTP